MSFTRDGFPWMDNQDMVFKTTSANYFSLFLWKLYGNGILQDNKYLGISLVKYDIPKYLKLIFFNKDMDK